LLGFLHATILSFDDGEIREVDYEMTDHYQITKYFLMHREKLLKGREIYSEKIGIFAINFVFIQQNLFKKHRSSLLSYLCLQKSTVNKAAP
jgi:hypothetical protein